jgi:hypothetical protein
MLDLQGFNPEKVESFGSAATRGAVAEGRSARTVKAPPRRTTSVDADSSNPEFISLVHPPVGDQNSPP